MNRRFKRIVTVLGAVLLAGALLAWVVNAATSTSFKMVRSSVAVGADWCERTAVFARAICADFPPLR